MTNTAGGPPRVALYSHDAMGLGHVRRNLAIAEALAADGASVLLIAGTPEVRSFALPRGVDALVLPGIAKSELGDYFARSLRLDLHDLAAVRSASLEATLAAFAPSLVVVDKLPLGVAGELEPALRTLREASDSRLVLGLRDVLDEPERVRAEWRSGGVVAAVRELYDEIWVYGSADVYDTVEVYGLPADLAAITHYTGYLGRRGLRSPRRPSRDGIAVPPGPLQLCVVGGGQDGYAIADTFCHARMPSGTTGVVVAGPFMPAAARRSLAAACAARDDMTLVDFVPDPERLLAAAANVVAMGGYNTVCELLALGTRALIVPRVLPRREQIIRAERLAELGFLEFVHPDELSPAAISDWLARSPDGRRDWPSIHLDLDGLTRVQSLSREHTQPCASVTS